MKKSSLFNYITGIFGLLLFNVQSFLFRKLIRSKNAWRLYDEAEIEGFGINLVRLYFPVYYDKKVTRQSFSFTSRQQIAQFMSAGDAHHAYNKIIIDELEEIIKLPVQQTDNITPYLDNYYYGIYDAAVLFAIMEAHKPRKIIEIGSGISTRYIKHFKNKLGLDTQIVCIDPMPRVDIANVADTVIRQPFENVIADEIFNLKSGDIIFMDGSHYVFQGNDTLCFFFKLLPSLPKGIIIHIHDIYLPFDYPEGVARQLWTEQYILAAMMSGGFKDLEILYPAYYISQTNDEIKKALIVVTNSLDLSQFSIKLNHTEGYSIWIRKI